MARGYNLSTYIESILIIGAFAILDVTDSSNEELLGLMLWWHKLTEAGSTLDVLAT